MNSPVPVSRANLGRVCSPTPVGSAISQDSAINMALTKNRPVLEEYLIRMRALTDETGYGRNEIAKIRGMSTEELRNEFFISAYTRNSQWSGGTVTITMKDGDIQNRKLVFTVQQDKCGAWELRLTDWPRDPYRIRDANPRHDTKLDTRSFFYPPAKLPQTPGELVKLYESYGVPREQAEQFVNTLKLHYKIVGQDGKIIYNKNEKGQEESFATFLLGPATDWMLKKLNPPNRFSFSEDGGSSKRTISDSEMLDLIEYLFSEFEKGSSKKEVSRSTGSSSRELGLDPTVPQGFDDLHIEPPVLQRLRDRLRELAPVTDGESSQAQLSRRQFQAVVTVISQLTNDPNEALAVLNAIWVASKGKLGFGEATGLLFDFNSTFGGPAAGQHTGKLAKIKTIPLLNDDGSYQRDAQGKIIYVQEKNPDGTPKWQLIGQTESAVEEIKRSREILRMFR